MDREKAMEFIKKHKVEFIVGAGVMLSGIFWAVTRKSLLSKNMSFPMVSNGIRNISIPNDFSVGKVNDLWEQEDEIVAIVQEITTNNLGELGREFVKHDLMKDGAEISVIIEALKNE